MGLNTTVVVLNDAIGAIESDPTFSQRLATAVTDTKMGPKDVSALGHAGAAVVLETHHSSVFRSVWTGGNLGIVQDVLVPGDLLTCDGFEKEPQESVDVKLLRAVADELGYRIVKRKK